MAQWCLVETTKWLQFALKMEINSGVKYTFGLLICFRLMACKIDNINIGLCGAGAPWVLSTRSLLNLAK